MSISAIGNLTNTVRGDVLVDDAHSVNPAWFLLLGVSSVVYLRSCEVEGDLAYAIHGADGALLGVVEDIDVAIMLASEHGMTIVAVH
jgi:hypothetical protein